MTPYEIWRGKKLNLKHLHEFGRACFVLNDREHRRKFDLKSDKDVFLGYSLNSKAYKVINKRSKIVMESTNVVVDYQGVVFVGLRSDESETEGSLHRSGDDASTNDATPGNSSSPDIEDASSFSKSLSQPRYPTTSSMRSNREASRQVQKDHSTIDIIGDPKAGVQTRGKPKVNYRMMDHFVEHMSSESK